MVFTVRVVWPAASRVELPSVAVTPAGAPMSMALRSTAPVKPPLRVSVTMAVPDAPGVRLRVAGAAASAKLGAEAASGGASALSMDWPLGVPQPLVRS